MPKFQTKYGEVEFESEVQFEEYLKLSGDDSHTQFMSGRKAIAHVVPTGQLDAQGNPLGAVDDRTARQSMRRQEAIKNLVNEVALHRIQPGTGIAVEYMSFERWQELSSQYMQAIKSGDSQNEAFRQVGFQPLAIYMGKLMSKRKDGSIRKIRDLFVNEVGVRPNGTIVCLQDKMPGDLGTVVVGAHTKYRDPHREVGTDKPEGE